MSDPTDSAAGDEDGLAELAERAVQTGEEEAAIPRLRAGAERHRSATLWQWTALLQRSLDEHGEALDSFSVAAGLAPDDFKIAQGRAHTAMEAGLNAVELYEYAHALAPRSGPILIGLAAALAAAGDAEGAIARLRATLENAPAWLVGYEQLAQLLSTQGRSDEATAPLEQAIERFPREPALRKTLLDIQLRRGAYQSLVPILDDARAAGAALPDFAIYEAIHAAECEDEPFPASLFGPSSLAYDFALETWRVRHLLRLGEVDAALPIVDRGIGSNRSAELWTYAATAWRMAGDPRSDWLEGDPRLVQTIELGGALPRLDLLGEALRDLHRAKGEYLDQSVRGGTQTDGPLFSRIDPLIRSVRTAAAAAVRTYVEQLPPIDATHPLLRHRRDRRVRFSGSWSVRLQSGGRHANHVHPQGWISSALYIALPTRALDCAHDDGWLALGQPDDNLQLALQPRRKIEPLQGRLVLFPSWMWHGTVPFADGERLTIAFDVRPPV